MRRQCRLLRFLWALAAPYSLAYVAVEARVPVAPDSVKLLEASHRGSGLVAAALRHPRLAAAAAPPRGAAAKQELSPPSRRLTTSGFTVIGTQSSASGSLPHVTEGAFLLPGASVTVYEDSQSLEHTISIEADVAGAGSLSASSVEALFDKYSVRSLIEQALFDGLTTRCKVAMMGVTATQSSAASPSTWSLAITYLGTVVAPTASACFILEGLANEMADLCTSGSTAMQTFRDNFETGMASVAATDGTSLSFVLEGFSSGVGISCGTSEPSYSGVTTEVLDAAVGSLDCFPIFPSIDNWVPPSDCPNEHGTSCAFQCASGYSLWCFGDVTLDPVPRSACYDGFPSVEAACGQIECHAAEHYVLAGECRPDCGAAPSLSMVWDGTENVDNDSLALCAGRSHGALCELVCVYGFHSQDRDGNKPGTFMCVDGAYEGELACIGSTCEGLSPNLLYDAASDEMVDAGTSDTGHELASMTDCTDMPFLGQCSIYCQAGLTQICEEDYARIEINGVSYGQPSDGNANCETIKCSQGDVVVPRHRCLAPCTVPPLNIAFSTTDFSQTCTYGEHGTTCSFECQTGYHPSGLVVCVEGSFLNDQTCLPDDCVGAPITGSNYLSGSSSPCWNLEHGGECYVSCDSGYTIACGTPNDDPQIHDALTCARVTCSLGQFVIHGTHWCAAKCYIEPTFFDRVMPAYPYSNGWYPCQPAVHGYVCSFGCVEGASPAGELVCNDGYFVGGSCNEDGCTGVPALTFDRTRGDPWMYPGWGANMDTSAMSDCENMGSNTSCEISCVAGSTLYCEDTSDPAAGVVNPVVDDISCDIIHCRRGVRYIPNVRCVEDCTGLPVTEFAVAETVAACDPMWHNYEPCEWECIEGADPEEPILCWEGDYTVTPTCIPRNCSGFPDLQSAQTPVNAWQSTFAYDYDAMADCIDLVHTGSCEIACAPGYSFTCGSDGLGDPASCLTIGCYLEVIDVPQHKCVENCWYSQIADIAHATLESLLACNDTVHTGTCPMECVDGWHNEGKGVFTCTLSFFEEDSFPYCEEDPCLDSPEPLGLFPTYASGHTCFDSGTVHCNADRCARGIDHGETCIPVCNEGYYLVGNLGCSFGNYTAENGLDCLPYDGCGPLPILGKYMRTIDLVRGTLTHLEPPEENHLARYSVTCALPRWELPGKDLEPQIYECHDGAWEVLLPGGPDGWPGGDWVPHADAALLECQELPCVPRAVPDDGEGRYICNDSLTDEGNYPHYSVCFLDCAAEGYVADPPHVMYQCSYMDVYTASSMNLGLGVLGTVPTSGTLYYDYYLPDLAPAATQAFFSPRAIRDMLDGNGSVYVFDNIEASCALLTCDLPEFYAGDIPVVLDGDTRDVSSGSPSMLKLVCIGTSYQSTCSPECRDGFEPMGNLECNSLGVFEGRPICKRTAAECRDLPQLPDSLVDVATLSSDCAGLDTGGRCEVTCNEGYTASGSGTWYYECASGAFSSSPVSSGGDSNMVCTVNPCTELPSSLLLASDMSHCTLPASYGSTCDVKCEPGYRPSVDTITCGSVQAGSWYIPPQVCVLEENYKEGTGDFEDSTVVAISLTLTSNPQEEELSYRALALETIKTEKVATPGISAHEMVLVVAAALDAVAAVPPRHEILALLVGAVENGLSLQEQANYTIAALQFLLTEPDEADAATTGSDYAQVVLNDGADAGQSAQALARALLASDLSLSSWLALGAVVDAASGLVQVQLRGASAGGSRRLTLGGEALGEGGSPALGELAGSLFASLRQVSRADLGLATWEPSSRDRALAAERTRRGCLAAGDAAWEAEVAAAYAAARLAGIALANLSAARAAADFLSAVQEAVAEPSSAVADAGARASQIDAVAAALCAHLPGADGAAGAGAEAAYAVCVEAGLARAEAVQVAAACAFVACTGSSLECLASVGKTVGMLARVHRLGAAEAAEAAALAALGRGFNTTEQLALAAAAGARPFGLETAALTAAVIPASVEPGDARIAVGRVSTASIHDALVAALGELYMESPLSVSCGITAALAAKAADVLVEPSRIALAVQQVLVLEEMSVSYSQQYIDQCALTAAGLVRGLAGQQDFSFVAAEAPLFAPSSATREDFGTTVNSLVVDQGMTEIARCVATYPTALAHKYSHGDAAIISALAYGITKDEIEAFRSSYTDSPPKTIQEVMDEAALGVGTVSHAVKVAAVAKDEGLSFVEAALFALVDATTLEELQAGVTTERAVLILSRLALSTAPVASCFGGTASELVEALLALWYFQAEGGGSAGPDAVTLSAIVVILAAIAMHEETFDEAVEDMAWRAVKALPRRQGKDIDLLEARFRAAGAALAATAGVSAAAREIAASVSTGPTRDAADFAGVPFTPMGQNAFDWSSEHAAAVYDAVLYASGDAKVAGRAVAIVGESRGESASWAVATAGYLALLRQSGELAFFGGPVEATRAAANAALAELSERNITADSLAAARKGVAVVVDTALLVEAATAVSRMIPELIPFMSVPEAFETAYEQVTALATESRTPQAIAELVEGALAAAGATDMVHLAPWLAYVAARLGDLSEDAASEACVLAATRAGLDVADAVARAGLVRASLHLLTLRSVQEIAVITYELYGADSISQFEGSYAIARGYAAAVDAADLTGRQRVRWQLLQPYLAATATDQRVVRNETVALVGGGASGAALGQQLQPLLGAGWQATAGAVYFAVWEAAGAAEAVEASWAAAGAAGAASLPAAAAQTSVPQGCFFYGWRFSPEMRNITQNPVKDVKSAEDCQVTCATTTGCMYFSWERALQNCWLADNTMKRFSQEAAFVAGMSECDGPSALCSAMPGPDFPGQTAADSDNAWPTGFVPPKLQCWPRDDDGELVPCEQEMTILDDSAAGWPGKCLGLEQAPDEKNGTSCEEQCRAADSCSVWQQVTDDDGSLHCWIGFGSDCFHSARKAHITSAQRILRGSFRVLMDLKGFEVGEAYLKKVFDALPEDSHGFGQSVDEAARQCNHTCLSLVTCELWQYSSKVGCQINDPKFKALPYPLTTAVVHTGTPKAEAVIAGAYIQRACKSAPKRGPSKLAAEIVRNATTKVSTTEASTVTSTTGPSTTSVTTTAVTTTTVTSKTTILPLAPLPGEPDLFIRGKQASEVYFRDGETSTKHLVRFNSCSRCPKKVQELCGRPAQVTEGEILGLETGEDFECDMFNPGEARPVEDQMQTVPPQHGRGPSAPTDKLDESGMTTLTDRSTTTTTTAALAAALGAGAHHAARRGGLPWWLWALLLAGIVGIVACVAYAARHKRRGRSPPRTRASRLQKEASGATGSTAAHDKSVSLASSFDSEAAAPLMASPPDGQAHEPSAGTLQALGSRMGQPLQQAQGAPQTQMLSQTPQTQMLSQTPQTQMMSQDLDLVTVTPQGLAVTPLNGNPPPPGVPMLQERPQLQGPAPAGAPHTFGTSQASSFAALQQAGARQDMDLVTVTPQGLAVTPLNGNLPPAGVPFLGPGSAPGVAGYGHMPTGIQAPQLPTGQLGPQGAAWPQPLR